jgi:hypothetical protein
MGIYNDVLIELQDYMLNDENIKKALQLKCLSIDNNKNNNINDKNKEKKIYEIYEKQDKNKDNHDDICKNKKVDLFIPREQDTLFWCFYIMKNGYEKYETILYKNSLLAKQLKIDLVSTIRKNKNILKIYKFDTITNIENNLANENNMNIKTFFSLCAIENLNVILTCKKTYLELIMNDSNIFYNLQEISFQSKYYNKFGFTTVTKDCIDNIRNTLFKVNNFEKPIKCLSVYKVADLIDICNKLSIEIIDKKSGKNKSKNDLYESIIQYF